MPPSSNATIARLIPDLHRWVEARALLLADACKAFASRKEPELSVLVHDVERGTVFVIGPPDLPANDGLLHKSSATSEVVVGKEHATTLRAALFEWTASTILVHRLADAHRLPDVLRADVRLLDPATIPRLPIDAELKQELEDGAEGSVIAARFVDGQPVAFCYAGAVTESLWDIAVDTVEEHRRRGHAALCVAHMVQHMRALGKAPVWQAVEENPASWRLASKLGFEPVDALVLFERRHAV